MMATIEVKNLDGKAVGKVDLDDSVFGVEVNEHLLWEVVKAQRAKRRAGTHSTKRRDEVRGGGKKPYKQKGTGNARQGSTRAPHYVGGGKVFTPKPRDYEYHVPKKVMAGALRSALSLRAKEQKVVVVDSFTLDAPKTKLVDQALTTLGAKSALLVDGANDTLKKSTRNLQHAKYLAPEGLNVYDVLDHETLIMSRATLDAVTARLKGSPRTEEGAA
jgi:large subunit ribosomal protein L4